MTGSAALLLALGGALPLRSPTQRAAQRHVVADRAAPVLKRMPDAAAAPGQVAGDPPAEKQVEIEAGLVDGRSKQTEVVLVFVAADTPSFVKCTVPAYTERCCTTP